MPAHRKPTRLHLLYGSYKKNPQRQREREGEPEVIEPLGEPPKHLDANQRKAWREIARTAPEGVLTRADRVSVELAAVLLAQLRGQGADFTPTRLAQLRYLLGQFGMTPADRSRVTLETKPRKPNPFDDF